MHKILLFSFSGFSDENANGITMKNLLSAWTPAEKAEFYCDVQPPDYTAAHHYFRVTDTQMLKAFLGKRAQNIFSHGADGVTQFVKSNQKTPKRIPAWLKKHKYNFWLKSAREYLWMLSPWGHRKLDQWILDMDPDVIAYMVGESLFMDKLVLRTCQRLGKPLVLYNAEAFRIIDTNKRYGLERVYYKKIKKLYARLNDRAALIIYNSQLLQDGYEEEYPRRAEAVVTYNSAQCNQPAYEPKGTLKIVYFGNMGVGRSDVLLETAEILGRIHKDLVLDIYGNTTEDYVRKFQVCPNICYHGFVDAQQLHRIVGEADILLHVESFDEEIMARLKYAFSTKIAQCLCAGRCFVSYAPQQTASTQYLLSSGGAVVASDARELELRLTELVNDGALRQQYAQRALQAGLQKHCMQKTAEEIRKMIEEIA